MVSEIVGDGRRAGPRFAGVTAAVSLAVILAVAAPCLAQNAGRQPEAAERDWQAPELTGDRWFNKPGGKPVRLADRLGKVTVVHFWTFG